MTQHVDRRAGLPFGVHQALDYLLGLFLALNAVHIPPTAATLVLGLGGALLLLPLVSDGPLGGWRLLSPATHRVGDFLIIIVAATSPWLFHLGWDLSVVVFPLATAALAAALSVATCYRRPVPKRSRRGNRSVTGDAPAQPAQPAQRRLRPAAPTARSLGRVVARVQSEGPRALGRAVGRLKR